MEHSLEDLGQGSILPPKPRPTFPHPSNKHIPRNGVCRFHTSLSQLAGGGTSLAESYD